VVGESLSPELSGGFAQGIWHSHKAFKKYIFQKFFITINLARFRQSLTRAKLTTKMILSELLKSKRETKNLLLREVASMIGADTALISKIEKGDRKPTREQIDKLAIALGIEHSKLLMLWLSEKVYEDVKGEDMAIEAVKLTLKRLKTEQE